MLELIGGICFGLVSVGAAVGVYCLLSGLAIENAIIEREE